MTVTFAEKPRVSVRPDGQFHIRARMHLEQREPGLAVELCKRGLIYYPENVSGYIVMAQAYLMLEKQEHAMNVLRDGHRRTGSTQLETLRARVAGEVTEPVHENGTASAPGAVEEEREVPAAVKDAVDQEEEDKKEGIPAATALPEPVKESMEEPEGGEKESTEKPGTLEPASEDRTEVALEDDSLAQAEPNVPEPNVFEPNVSEPNVSEPEATARPAEPAEPAHTPQESPVSLSLFTGGGERRSSEDSIQLGDFVNEERSSLALHTGMSPRRLRSSNLRLIPGLEFAPLRHEEPVHGQSIAPLIHEPMPGPKAPFSRSKAEEVDFPPLPPLGAVHAEEPVIPEPATAHHREPDSPEPAFVFVSLAEQMATERREATEQMKSPEIENVEKPTEPEPAGPVPEKPDSENDLGLPPLDMMPETRPRRRERREGSTGELTPLEELARRLETARIPIVEEDESHQPPAAFEPTIVSDTLANILVAQGAYSEALKAFQTLARMKPGRFDHYQEKIQEMKWRMLHPDKAEAIDEEDEE